MNKTISVLAVLAAVVFMVVSANPAIAQEEEKSISRIVVEGNKRIPEEMILTYVTLEAGDKFDDRIIQNDFRALWNTDLFSDIEFLKRDDSQGGIVLVIKVVERPKVRKIIFEGLNTLSESGIQEKMEHPIHDLSIPEGSVLSYNKLSHLTRIIQELLKENGLEFGEVKFELRPVNDIEVDVAYLVSEGGKVKISEVRFLGNDSFSQWKLMTILKKSRPTWLFSWIEKDNIYSSELLSQDLEEIRKFYAENGFLRVAMKEPVVETIEDNPLLSARDMRAIITIPVKEGIRYKINTVKFDGNTLFSDEAMTAMLNMKEGEIYNKKQIDDSIEQISNYYKNQGYIEIFISENITYPLDKKGFVDIELKVNEGDAYFVGTIDFKGNRTTRDKVLRRNIFLSEEAPFSFKSFEDSMRRINQLGFFGAVDYDLDIDRESKRANIKFDVTETGRNQVQFGGGYSGIEGAFVNFAFTTQNFWGQGQTASLMVQTGDRNNNYEISFFEPWLMDKPIGAGITFFSRRWEFSDFIRRGDGGRANISLRLGRFLSFFLAYRYELVEIQNPEGVTYGTSIFYPEGKTATGSITPTLIRNTVDHPLLPTRGHKDTLKFEWGATWLGGDFDFYKITAEHISNFPITSNNIFRFRVQAGWAETLEDGYELPVFERYFMGGENTLRGYELRTVGPRDEDERIIGGTKSFLINIENNFLITREFRIVPFFDAGNAFSEEINFDDLLMSAGVEMRFFIPQFNIPFRFIIARPINPEDYHRTNSFQFTIGSIF